MQLRYYFTQVLSSSTMVTFSILCPLSTDKCVGFDNRRSMKHDYFIFLAKVKLKQSLINPSDFVYFHLLNSPIQIQWDKPWFSAVGSDRTSVWSWSSGVNCIHTGFELQADGALPCSAFLFLFVRKIMETKFMVKLKIKMWMLSPLTSTREC